jgi:antitoxin PrlF
MDDTSLFVVVLSSLYLIGNDDRRDPVLWSTDACQGDYLCKIRYTLIRRFYFQCKQGDDEVELAKVTMRGQITIPIEIRRKLNIKDGDKVVFIEENGKIIMENSAIIALREVQDAFHGEAERLGLQNDQDVVDMVKEVRQFGYKKHECLLLDTD